jgi:hypothetical protein
MIIAYFVGGVLVWVAIAFGLATLFRGTDDRDNAHIVAWVTGFWPVTGPVIIAVAVVLGVCCGLVWVLDQGGKGIAKLGGRYIDFIHGEKKPPAPPNLKERVTAAQQEIVALEKKMRANGWRV